MPKQSFHFWIHLQVWPRGKRWQCSNVHLPQKEGREDSCWDSSLPQLRQLHLPEEGPCENIHLEQSRRYSLFCYDKTTGNISLFSVIYANEEELVSCGQACLDAGRCQCSKCRYKLFWVFLKSLATKVLFPLYGSMPWMPCWKDGGRWGSCCHSGTRWPLLQVCVTYTSNITSSSLMCFVDLKCFSGKPRRPWKRNSPTPGNSLAP